MTVRSFGGTLGFGIAAGVGFPGFAVLASPIVGPHAALCLFVALGAIAYAALLGQGLRERVAGAFIAALFIVPTVLLTNEIAGVAMGAALAIAIARTRILGTSHLPRTVAVEAALAAFGFAFVTALDGPGWFPISLAIWGWFLVQSLYFLIGGLPAPVLEGDVDPFDLASEQANRILEHEPRPFRER